MIPVADWRPDLADLTNPTTEAKNVFPGEDGFRPIPSMQVQSDALTFYCRGAFAAKAKSGTAYNYAGDAQNLYLMSDNNWSEVNGNGGGANAYTALGANENWEFVKWGENVIAVGGANATDPIPQIAALDGADFTDLGGTPPRARHIAVVRNFIVLGNLYRSGAAFPDEVQWSGHNDETAWTSSPATQSDNQPLPNGGWVRGIRGGEYGVVFQEKQIARMDYVGPPEIFHIDEKPGIGTQANNSIIQRGDDCFFWGEDGFYVTTNGQTPQPIGRHILDRYIRNDLDASYFHRMVGAENKQHQVLIWIYPGVGNQSGLPNQVICYDYRTGRWSRAELDSEWIYDSLGTSIALDSFTAAGYTNLDTVGISLDSDIWKGGAVTFGIFDSDHKQNQLSGTAMSAEVSTREVDSAGLSTDKVRLPRGHRAAVTRVRPVCQGGTTTMKVGTRNDLEDSVTLGSELSEVADGSIPMRTNARYHRFQLHTTGDFDRILGVQPVEVADAGNR